MAGLLYNPKLSLLCQILIFHSITQPFLTGTLPFPSPGERAALLSKMFIHVSNCATKRLGYKANTGNKVPCTLTNTIYLYWAEGSTAASGEITCYVCTPWDTGHWKNRSFEPKWGIKTKCWNPISELIQWHAEKRICLYLHKKERKQKKRNPRKRTQAISSTAQKKNSKC